ncbi:GrpB family protein [Pseudorhodoferax sp.]|uniref:GrpB family protein n=1 Tax=Pseudorhodoferax sp. TaxID=1993553 RepID=UPI002DD65BDA|nr:GrpB family protein [Pseudorhodoferax sp.]
MRCQHLGFRDALRASPVLRDAYAALKQRLTAEHALDKAAYQDAKAPFIRQVLASLPP